MIQVFISNDNDGTDEFVASHHKFEVLPRVGEIVHFDENESEFSARVVKVSHTADSTADRAAPVSNVTLHVEVIDKR